MKLPYYVYQKTYLRCSVVIQGCFPHLGLIFVSSHVNKSVIRVKLLMKSFILFCIRRLGIIFIQKYNYKHKLIQRQIPGENQPFIYIIFEAQLRHSTI
jgi:hypothetical protein